MEFRVDIHSDGDVMEEISARIKEFEPGRLSGALDISCVWYIASVGRADFGDLTDMLSVGLIPLIYNGWIGRMSITFERAEDDEYIEVLIDEIEDWRLINYNY